MFNAVDRGLAEGGRKERLLKSAIELYRVRVFDNIDLSTLACPASRARVVARALMERGDARAFAIGRELMAAYPS